MRYLGKFLLTSCLLLIVTSTWAATTFPTQLIITQKTILIDGKKTWVYTVNQPDGTWGYVGVKGQYFDVIVKNETKQPTVLHWHGLILPFDQDGVPFISQPPIPPGGTYRYHFLLQQAGTFWMHSHYDLQLQRYMSAPFIVYDPADKHSTQDVPMLLADYSPKSPEAIFAELKKGMKMPTISSDQPSSSMSMPMSTHKPEQPDLNDVKYAALLTNYRTLKTPLVVRVQPGKTVRLRIINGAAATNFYVDTGTLAGTLIAMDGNDIHPISGEKFQIGEGQRLDILVKIPNKKIATYPILAQGEGTTMQTGLILATPAATQMPQLSEQTPVAAPPLNYTQEWQLKALHPLKPTPVTETLVLDLTGNMAKYEWKINNRMWPNDAPLFVNQYHRVELIINNKTNMAHPIHLHGHVFELTEIDGKPVINGAMHDTILVMPHSTAKVQFDSDNPGKWLLHCHMLYHQEAGMMTVLEYK